MSLAAGLRDLLDRARVEFPGHPGLTAIEADFTALHDAVRDGDPAADTRALEIVKGLYKPPPAPAKPAAKTNGGTAAPEAPPAKAAAAPAPSAASPAPKPAPPA